MCSPVAKMWPSLGQVEKFSGTNAICLLASTDSLQLGTFMLIEAENKSSLMCIVDGITVSVLLNVIGS
jgi:hypothetical protein